MSEEDRRVVRGGSWSSNSPTTALSSFRSDFKRSSPADAIGFRVVLAPAR